MPNIQYGSYSVGALSNIKWVSENPPETKKSLVHYQFPHEKLPFGARKLIFRQAQLQDISRKIWVCLKIGQPKI